MMKKLHTAIAAATLALASCQATVSPEDANKIVSCASLDGNDSFVVKASDMTVTRGLNGITVAFTDQEGYSRTMTLEQIGQYKCNEVAP
jgi:ribonuclease PH